MSIRVKRPKKPPTNPSGSSLRDFMREIRAEAEAEGPEAVAHLEALHRYYREEVARIRICEDKRLAFKDPATGRKNN